MPQTLNEWVKRDEVDNGVREGVTTSEAQRMKELEREVKELVRANEILKLTNGEMSTRRQAKKPVARSAEGVPRHSQE